VPDPVPLKLPAHQGRLTSSSAKAPPQGAAQQQLLYYLAVDCAAKTHAELKAVAEAAHDRSGGPGRAWRLPTNAEVKSHVKQFGAIHGAPGVAEAALTGAALAARTSWVPTCGFGECGSDGAAANGDRDWVLVSASCGAGLLGMSHKEVHRSYPGWGDKKDAAHSHKAHLLATREPLPNCGNPVGRERASPAGPGRAGCPVLRQARGSVAGKSWVDCQGVAAALGGRLPTAGEVKLWLGGQPFPGSPVVYREDCWVPVLCNVPASVRQRVAKVASEAGSGGDLKDWVRVSASHGPRSLGCTHLELHNGYPAWGDAQNEGHAHKAFLLYVESSCDSLVLTSLA
jgi:hypothetical protein